MPGRSLTPFEEQTLGEWKAAIHMPVVRCLGARDPQTRMAAVACLGSLPIDNAAAPAVRICRRPRRRGPETNHLFVLATTARF